MIGEHELQSPHCWKLGLAQGEAVGLMARLNQHRANMCHSCSKPNTSWCGSGSSVGPGKGSPGWVFVIHPHIFFNALVQVGEMLVVWCGNWVLL